MIIYKAPSIQDVFNREKQRARRDAATTRFRRAKMTKDDLLNGYRLNCHLLLTA